MFIVSIRKIIPFLLLFCLLCGAIVFTTATELFSQRGMHVTVRTESGKELALYKDSHALVIGNGAYPVKNGWNPLPGAVKDVKEVAAVLERHGFNVTLKIDVTQVEFNKAFSDFIYESGKDKDNRLLFYYAGHGYTTKAATGEDLGYLVMLDTPSPDNAGEFDLYSIDMVKFVSDSKKIHAKHVLFMFDSCFSGTILDLRNTVMPPHITDRIKNPVRQFITAGRADEPVPDRSEFKKAFLNLLEGHVDEPTPDGYLTGVELGDYLYRTVPKFSKGQHPQHGKIHDQQLNTGDFVFVLADNKQDGSKDSGIELDTMATLDITSTPSGATVYVDGILIGKTPVHGYKVDAGARLEKHVNVGLELSGYKSRAKKLTLKGGQKLPWDVSLEPITQGTSSSVDEAVKGRNKKEIPPTTPNPIYTYLALKPGGDNNTITPTNHHNNWGPFFRGEKTKSGIYYALDGFGQETPGSGWHQKDTIYNRYDRDFRHWIYSHAKSVLIYDLSGGNYAKFHGYIGIPYLWQDADTLTDASCRRSGSVEFTFLADDREVYTSGIITGVEHNKPIPVEFDIPFNTQKLKLIVTDGGDSSGCDHWTLGDARLLHRHAQPPLDEIKEEAIPLKQQTSGLETIIGKDGALMALIPAGDFLMGTPVGTYGNSVTKPAHTVYLDAFYMDVHEVTVGQYNQFVRATRHRALPAWVSEYSPTDRHPVVGVSWHDAKAYAKWAGKRLPTEAEWEKAARGGLVGKEYPWGNAVLDGTQCNFADKSLREISKKDFGYADKNIDDGYVYTAPVGSYPANGYGLFDMAGNVREWCFDAYDENFYVNSPRRNPIAGIIITDNENNISTVNNTRSVRGVSWYDQHVWIASRMGISVSGLSYLIGFRCAKSVTP